jgi:hypothetical protein
MTIALRATGIKPVKRSRISKSKKAYFRVLLDCDGDITTSDVAEFRVPHQRAGKTLSIRHWIRRIKSNINYSELVP